jgi:hypothetical protein
MYKEIFPHLGKGKPNGVKSGMALPMHVDVSNGPARKGDQYFHPYRLLELERQAEYLCGL